MAYHHDNTDQKTAAGFIDSGNLHGVVVGGCGLIFTVALQLKGWLPFNPLVTIAGVALGFYLGKGFWRFTVKGAERFGSSIYAPSGASTAYTPTFSHIEALEIKGDLDGAAVAWEAAIAERPESLLTIVRAADFHLRARKDPHTALEYYLRARALSGGTPDLRRYVQQKLVDLYLGPIADSGRAMVELRRLIDAFPNTREAEGARVAVAELKQSRNS